MFLCWPRILPTIKLARSALRLVPTPARPSLCRMFTFPEAIWPTSPTRSDRATVRVHIPGTSRAKRPYAGTVTSASTTMRRTRTISSWSIRFCLRPGFERIFGPGEHGIGALSPGPSYRTIQPERTRRSQHLVFLEPRARRPQYALGHIYPVSDSRDPPQCIWRSAFGHSEPLAGLGLCASSVLEPGVQPRRGHALRFRVFKSGCFSELRGSSQ